MLFTDGPTAPSRQHFWGKLRLFCRRARVPLVCPHSLRGLHATLAIEAGATGGMVAHALGHGSFQVTARHYATAESIAGSRAARVSEALGTKDDVVSRLLVMVDCRLRDQALLACRIKVSADLEVQRSRAVNLDAPCPCGSGRRYKHCCLQ